MLSKLGAKGLFFSIKKKKSEKIWKDAQSEITLKINGRACKIVHSLSTSICNNGNEPAPAAAVLVLLLWLWRWSDSSLLNAGLIIPPFSSFFLYLLVNLSRYFVFQFHFENLTESIPMVIPIRIVVLLMFLLVVRVSICSPY